MTKLPALLKGGLAGVCLSCCFMAGALANDSVPLSPEDMRLAAVYASRNSDPRLALRLAKVLLERDPNDTVALLVQSRAARDLGEFELALSSAKKAWRTAKNDQNRYAAAASAAQALSSNGNRTRAQLWLRRAAQVAPDDRLKAIAIRDFRYVRSRNPLTTHIEFGVTPSSNVNGGSSSETLVVGGFPFKLNGDARALSGLEYNYGIQTQLQHQQSPTIRLNVGAELEGRTVRLSSKAKKQTVNLDASDLSYQAARFSFGATFFEPTNGNSWNVQLATGKSWYGSEQLADFAQIDVEKTVVVDPKNRLRLGLLVDEQWRKDNSLNSSSSLTGSVGWSKRFKHGSKLELTVAARETQSDSDVIAHDAKIASVAYNVGKPLFGAYFGVSATYEKRDYGAPYFTEGDREDERFTFSANALFPEYHYYGFAPEIGVNARKTNSNSALYDTEEVGLEIGFRSVF